MFRHQKGAALFVSLMLLVVLTLMAVSAINTSTVNLRVVDNLRAQRNVEELAINAIEQVMSDEENFYTRDATVIDGVTVDARECIAWSVATGYSAEMENPIENTRWMVRATVTSDDGATTSVVQGTTIAMPANNCSP